MNKKIKLNIFRTLGFLSCIIMFVTIILTRIYQDGTYFIIGFIQLIIIGLPSLHFTLKLNSKKEKKIIGKNIEFNKKYLYIGLIIGFLITIILRILK